MRILLICNYKGAVGGISGQVEILQRHLRAEGHHANLFNTKGSVPQRLGMLNRLRAKAADYDVLHIHCCSGWGFLPAVLGVTVGRRLHKRIVLTYHGGGAEEFFAKHTRLVHHYLGRTDANIVLNGFLASVFARYGLPCMVIPNILDFDESQYRLRNPIQPNFICIRAHEPLYNIPCLLRAFAAVQQQRPEATLTLVGDGSEHLHLRRMASDMGLQGVTFTGRVANSEIYNYLDRADIMLSSPRKDNMPVSLLEAMNAGLLVISSRVGGVPYIIKHGTSGLLFDSDDSAQLASLMILAVSKPDESIAMIANAHNNCFLYHWENIRTSIYQAYAPTS